MTRFYWAAMVNKCEGGSLIHNLVAGWCMADSEQATIALAFNRAKELKPDFSVDQIIIGQIPD